MHIMVVDDEEAMRESLAAWLRRDGHQIALASSGEEALSQLGGAEFDLLLIDVKMPGMDGLQLLSRVREEQADLPVVMITAYGAIETAVDAMKKGASDYLLKPFDPQRLSVIIAKIAKHREVLRENLDLKARLAQLTREQVGNMVAGSDAMLKVMDLIRDVAPTDSAVLITGETGTGKELAARAIHALSTRSYGPFVVINCGAQAEALLESELFGHERGAFTGAVQARRGRLEMAAGGTLFLDEVGEISPKMQVDLLRVLEEKQFTRVGGTAPLSSDFRLVCATHRDLPEMLRAETFRADFYYRINVVGLRMPPLHEREGDIEVLAQYFCEHFSKDMGKPIEGLTPQALQRLSCYEWPGNVRELRNVIERAVVIGRGPLIGIRELTFLDSSERDASGPLSLQEVEILHIRRTLDAQDWNITQAAKSLGIDRATLSRKIKRHDLKRDG